MTHHAFEMAVAALERCAQALEASGAVECDDALALAEDRAFMSARAALTLLRAAVERGEVRWIHRFPSIETLYPDYQDGAERVLVLPWPPEKGEGRGE